jgi:collagen beta-1,O-galactosyltransferase
MIANQEIIQISKSMKRFVTYPIKNNLGFSNVYMINLLRRPERRQRMLSCFDELGIEVEIINAVDGR